MRRLHHSTTSFTFTKSHETAEEENTRRPPRDCQQTVTYWHAVCGSHATYSSNNVRNPLTRELGDEISCSFLSSYLAMTASNIPHNDSNSAIRFFSIILWLAATYVLSDLYSAQLTSQLARPSKELPINTLQRLEHVLNATTSDGYKLLVEKDSASFNVLMNGTGIMHRLYKTMEQQGHAYLLDSVEQGVRAIVEEDKTVVFAGRQTLYFNMKRYGIAHFQLSEKLFTRYSAISLQKGCLFLDSLNGKYGKSVLSQCLHFN